MSVRPQPRPGVMQIEAYVPGKSKAAGVAKVHKLSSNETPLSPSPKALQRSGPSITSSFIRTALPPSPRGDCGALRPRSEPDHLRLGLGRTLAMITHAYVGPGDEGIFTEHGFLVYRIAILAAGGVPVVAPEKDLRTDVDAILSRVTDKTKIVFSPIPTTRPAPTFRSTR